MSARTLMDKLLLHKSCTDVEKKASQQESARSPSAKSWCSLN
jgi:hypothetical protein